MRTGAAISGVMHGGLILFAVIGPAWVAERAAPPPAVTEIALVEGTELDAALSSAPEHPGRVPTELAAPAPPRDAPVSIAEPDDSVPPSEVAGLVAAPVPEARPERPEIVTAPVPRDVPTAPPDPTMAEIPSPDPVMRAAPRPESPVSREPVSALASATTPSPAPAPMRPPEPEPEPAEESRPEPEEAEETAEAAEAAEPADPLAPLAPAPRAARLPLARPAEIAAAAQAARAAARAAEEAETEPEEDKPAEPARAEAEPDAPEPGPRETSGAAPSRFDSVITRGEKDALRANIRRHFIYNNDRNDPTLRVTIAIELSRDGRIIDGPTEIESRGKRPAIRKALYQAGRRALIKAAIRGEFEVLPREKYDAWKRMHVTFTPLDIGFAS